MSEQRTITTDKAVIKKLAALLGIEESEVRHVKEYDHDGKPTFVNGALVTPSHYVVQNAKAQEHHIPIEQVDPAATPAIPAGAAPAPTPAPAVAIPAAPAPAK